MSIYDESDLFVRPRHDAMRMALNRLEETDETGDSESEVDVSPHA